MISTITKILLFILLILCVIYFIYNYSYHRRYKHIKTDNYEPIYYTGYNWLPSPSTRNMSYDIRGDIPIPYYIDTPFNMSTRVPIMNKPLYMVS